MITKLNYRDRSIKSYAMRKLTPFECFRLMGVRDDVIRTMQSTNAQAEKRIESFKSKGKKDEMAVSATQQYRQAGNSIVVDVLAYIYEQLWYPKHRDPITPNPTIPEWQKDMARWCNKRMIFCTTDFKDFMPRKGFRCEGYLREYELL